MHVYACLIFGVYFILTDELSWYIQDAANILATRIVKKPIVPTKSVDRGETQIFHNFMHSWVCYECVKILFVFGLQPKIRSDISNWSPELDSLFKYYSDKNVYSDHEARANEVVDILFNKTAHTGYFNKIPFVGKKKIYTMIIPSYY